MRIVLRKQEASGQNKYSLGQKDEKIVLGATLNEHISNLRMLFQLLRTIRLNVQPDKGEFLLKEVKFLARVVTPNGITIQSNTKKGDQVTFVTIRLLLAIY